MTTWTQYPKQKSFPKLKGEIKVDVAIIGGGMAGILNAYLLSKAGLKVALVEKNEVGSGATAATTAFITQVIDSNLSQIISLFGEKGAKLVWQSGQDAIEEFGNITKEEKIDCEFMRTSNFIFANDQEEFEELEEELKFYKRLKLNAKLEEVSNSLGFDNHGSLEIPNQAKFHPLKFLYSLSEAAEAIGAQIFEHSKVIDLRGDGPFTLETADGTIVSEDVVITTYKPLSNERTHLKKAMYRSYVMEAEIPKDLLQEGIFEDMDNPYHYFRVDKEHDGNKDYDRLILGGADHKDIFGSPPITRLQNKSFESLDDFAKKILGGNRYWIVRKWDGPILEPSDGLPLIGEIRPHQFVATGFSGNGMTYSMISALLIRDLIIGSENPWKEVYDPTRTLLNPKRLASKAKDYIEEFWNGALKNMLS
jgi:glycine/D-amino acid oxidase-like deaminating enzyme